MVRPVPYELYERKTPLLDRFIRYALIPTASDPDSSASPSTAKQLRLAELLRDELLELGLSDAALSPFGVVSATLPASPGAQSAPVLALIAHMDTSPEASDEGIRPQVAEHWSGEPIELDPQGRIVLSSALFPELDAHRGEDIICTDGTTLLGADDKAGIAAIMDALDWFRRHPQQPHAAVRVFFTPDEEIGRGTEHLSVPDIGASYGFTVDGGEVGGLDSETFNAAEAEISFTGISVHPGSAFGKMVNAVKLASRFVLELPQAESPERTKGREGFFHPVSISGTVEKAKLRIIIRDHDDQAFEERKSRLRQLASGFDCGRAPRPEVTIRDQYYNMKRYIEDRGDVLERAREAIRSTGIEPVEQPVRGGTDGAFLSRAGLPCPNLFTGGLNYHGIYECLPVPSLEKAAAAVRSLIARSAL